MRLVVSSSGQSSGVAETSGSVRGAQGCTPQVPAAQKEFGMDCLVTTGFRVRLAPAALCCHLVTGGLAIGARFVTNGFCAFFVVCSVLLEGFVMSFFEWIDIEITRFSIWLRNKREYPNHRIRVRYEGQGSFSVLQLIADTPAKMAIAQAERKAALEREGVCGCS